MQNKNAWLHVYCKPILTFIAEIRTLTKGKQKQNPSDGQKISDR
jgi:hypothetical protein